MRRFPPKKQHFTLILLRLAKGKPSGPRSLPISTRTLSGSATMHASLPRFDMQFAPEPRYDLLPATNGYQRITVQTARGCPLSCSFCAASIRLRPGYRTKSAKLVARDIPAHSWNSDSCSTYRARSIIECRSARSVHHFRYQLPTRLNVSSRTPRRLS